MQSKMNHIWVLEHKNGKVTKKKDAGKLNAYHNREGHTKRDNVKTIGLQDEQGAPTLVVDVPDGAEVFQRHRGNIQINYFQRFHDVTETTPETFDPNSRTVISARTTTRRLGEITYGEVWLVGWRKRETDQTVTVYFKALYPDGKIDEHHGWNEKPWLYEPEWFAEEQI
jgi:hypothetical protein